MWLVLVGEKLLTSGKVPFEKTINKQVLPHAPSPTMTSLRRISVDMAGRSRLVVGGSAWVVRRRAVGGGWRRCVEVVACGVEDAGWPWKQTLPDVAAIHSSTVPSSLLLLLVIFMGCGHIACSLLPCLFHCSLSVWRSHTGTIISVYITLPNT